MADGYYDFSGAFGNLNSAIDSVGKRWKDRENRQTLASLGQDIETGNYAGAARKAFALGDADTGIKLASLGRTAQQESDWMKSNGGVLGLGVPTAAAPAAAPAPAIGTPNEIESRFVNTVKGAGLTNPVGLGAVAAYGKAESGFSPQNVNRSWSDPSESGQPGTAGGIMSWRAERLANLQNFAKQRGEAQPSVETQALFLSQEDPTLIPKLQQAKTPQEANQIMANAWRFAGYNREGGENARRLALTQQYAQRFGGQGGAPGAVPPQVAMTEADVQRLEAQQGNPVIDQQAPVQMAQAAPQSGAPMADLPAQGAAQAQGFAIPGEQQADASIANDPRVMNLQRALAGAPERFKPQIQSRLNILVDELKAQRQQNAPTDAVRNYRFYRQEEQAAGRQPMSFQQFRTENKDNPTESVNQRRSAALAAGLRESDPGFQSYILTGKMPREDAQPLSATDKKAILEADEGVASGESAIRALNEAKGLSKQAMSGPTAGWRAAAGNNLPDWMVPDAIASPAASEATANLENTVTSNALSQMKAIFGGNPTEGERKILLDIQGSIGQPDNVRQAIYDRAIRAAEARLAFNRQRSAELRGGTYYKPGTGQPGGQTRQAPQERAPAPDVSNAKQASDGNWYVPDPGRPGKYLMVQP